MRFLGLDVHRDFCEVAIAENGVARPAGQIKTSPAELELFACSLAPSDVVAMEATANALAIARIIEPHVARVVLANPKAVKAATGLRAKTDKIDARTLAQLLAGGFLAEVWTPDEQTRVRRRLISRRGHLVRQMVREKNQVHAVLQRQLKERPPMTDMFGVKGRVWLASQQEHLPVDEQQSVNACLRQIDFVKKEIELVDVEIAKQVLASEDIRRLMTLPGVSGVTATAILAAIGDVSRFPTPGHLVGYLGLSPRVHQSGIRACEARTHQQARTRRGPRTPGRGCLARRQNYRAAARVSSARQGQARREHRDGSGRAQARGDRMEHAAPQRGLCVRATIAASRKAAPL